MRKTDIKNLDKQWSLLVKDTAGWVCEFCKIKGIRMEAAHVVGRSHRATRWGNFFNGKYDLCGHCLCHNCHKQYDEHGPLENMIVNETIGADRKVMLQQFANQNITKYQEYETIKNILDNYKP